jgi:hypothetical protein
MAKEIKDAIDSSPESENMLSQLLANFEMIDKNTS